MSDSSSMTLSAKILMVVSARGTFVSGIVNRGEQGPPELSRSTSPPHSSIAQLERPIFWTEIIFVFHMVLSVTFQQR